MAATGSRALKDLLSVLDTFGDPEAARRKLEALELLATARLPRAADVRALHEAACYLRACPDNPGVLHASERILAGFARRGDVRRFRRSLEDTGIAGTRLHDVISLPMASWLARRAPTSLRIAWDGFEHADRLHDLVPLLMHDAEHAAFDEYEMTERWWMRYMRRDDESDGCFLARRVDALPMSDIVRQHLWDGLQIPMIVDPVPGTPSRTHEKLPRLRVTFRTRPLRRARPDLLAELAVPPVSVKAVEPDEGGRIVELAREAMLVRHRALDVFCHADAHDVRLVDCGDGLVFACIGIQPRHRLLLEAVYAFLTLQSGVPVGYVLTSALFGSSEVAYNVFPTWRGGESGLVYGRVLAMAAHVFRADSFGVDPYQLGRLNEEGLASGAWWFYQKLGFRAKDRKVLALMESELERMSRNPAHRSSRATLERLVQAPVFFHAGPARDDVLGHVALNDVGVRVMRYLSRRFGSHREAARQACADDAGRLLGIDSLREWTPDERHALERWAPLVLILPGIDEWTSAERRALVRVIRAKAGRRESDYVRLFDAHAKLRAAACDLAKPAWNLWEPERASSSVPE